MEQLERVKREFARQADSFASSAAITDEQLTLRLVDALGSAAAGAVLDVASGPGIVTAALGRRARKAIAFDLTPEMLEKARQRCARAGLTNVEFRQGSAADLPFADDAFDGVVTRLAIHHFSEPDLVFKEMFRVLRPGGRLVVADVVSSEDADEAALQNAIEMLRDPSHVRMLSMSELVSTTRATGLEIEAQTSWDKSREFEEWMGIVNDPERVAPLRVIAAALARAGQQAGMGLSLSEGKVVFFHRWHMVTARKAPS
jgi:ubiquinone/menaquinone biosynthesis C-methylase UbiE